jgi:hypothetical protein
MGLLYVPFIMSFILAAAALHRLVLAHDCSGADPETLNEAYVGKPEGNEAPGYDGFAAPVLVLLWHAWVCCTT